MSKTVLLILAVLFCLAAATVASAADPADTAAIAAAVKAYLTKETVESVYVEKLVPPFAAAIVSVKEGDGGTAYLQKRDSGWTVLLYSATPTEAALTAGGVPAETAKKLLE
jgi:hypothetical protein